MITLKTLPKATEQEVFDQVSKHLLKQGKKSEDEIDNCTYHNEEGLQCAAGCLIAADEYKKRFEGKTWRGLIQEGSVPEDHKVLIEGFQRIHDDFDPQNWRTELEKIAKVEGFKFINYQ